MVTSAPSPNDDIYDWGIHQSKTLIDDVDKSSSTNQIIAHCFKQLKQENFCLPRSRRRIIILPQKQEDVIGPTRPPQAPLQPIPSFEILEAEDIQEQPEDRQSWLSQRLKLRKDLESFGDTKRWLEKKSSITASEAKVLKIIHEDQNAELRDVAFSTIKIPKKKALRGSYRSVPQLRLPKPPSLSSMYSYLRSRKIKILELFHKVDYSENQTISREEFISTLKAAGAPLNNRELEDIVIYLSSLGKQNVITAEILGNTYKQWSLAQQRSTLPTAREYYLLTKHRALPKNVLSKSKMKQAPPSPKMDLLTVPSVNTEIESRPMTLEEMEDVGKRFRERKRQCKLLIPSINYTESCRLVRCGKKEFDEHCLPSTIAGDTSELIDEARRDTFLIYLQCWELCEAYNLPLTEDVLMRALLYPGDKIIFQKEEVRPVRQPGGFYSDWKIAPNLPLPKTQDLNKAGTKKPDKKTSKKIKKMKFKEFEKFARKLQEKRAHGSQRAHPNYFWPGHLLDKLRLYLPTVVKDQSLALFSSVKWEHQAYPASYHPNRWWPLRDVHYMTCAYYDAAKVYYIN